MNNSNLFKKNKNKFLIYLNYKIYQTPLIIYLAIIFLNIIILFFYARGYDFLPLSIKTQTILVIGLILSLALLVNHLGNKLPFWSRFCGRGITLVLFVFLLVGILFHHGNNTRLKDLITKTVNNGTKKESIIGLSPWLEDFITYFVAFILVGALLNFNFRNMPLKYLLNFIFLIILTLVFALCFSILFGLILGFEAKQVVYQFFWPIFGDGLSGGVIPMQEVISDLRNNKIAEEWYQTAFLAMTIGNIGSIILANIFKSLKIKHLCGNGNLIKKNLKLVNISSKKEIIKNKPNIIGAILVVMAIYIFSYFVYRGVHHLIKIPVHTVAFLCVFTLILNSLKIIPKEISLGADLLKSKLLEWFLPLLIAVLALKIDIFKLSEKFVMKSFFLCLFIIISGTIAPLLFSRLFGFYIFEAMISTNLSMSAMGGIGAASVVETTGYQELLPYAQIASRICGTILLIIWGPLLTLFF